MSLTSYRAAPPRVRRKSLWDLSRWRNRFERLCLLPEQIAEGDLSPVRVALEDMGCDFLVFQVFKRRKAACGRPLRSASRAVRFRELRRYVAFGRPGSDLLSRVLRRSTIGAGAFHGRVRNGNGCGRPAMTTRSAKRNIVRSWLRRTSFFSL